MKEYNRTTKKYDEVEKTGKLKKPEKCKGGRDHDYVLLIPKWVSRSRNLSREEIERYYDIEEGRAKMEEAFNDQLAVLGITMRRWTSSLSRFYTCSVCRKEKTEYEKRS